jgi:cell division protein FtsB
MRRSYARLDMVVTVCCMALLGYISWHMHFGPGGEMYRDRLQEQIAARQSHLDVLTAESKRLEARARLLRPESIDPDMVEELARRDLGLVRETDLIIQLKN